MVNTLAQIVSLFHTCILFGVPEEPESRLKYQESERINHKLSDHASGFIIQLGNYNTNTRATSRVGEERIKRLKNKSINLFQDQSSSSEDINPDQQEQVYSLDLRAIFEENFGDSSSNTPNLSQEFQEANDHSFQEEITEQTGFLPTDNQLAFGHRNYSCHTLDTRLNVESQVQDMHNSIQESNIRTMTENKKVIAPFTGEDDVVRFRDWINLLDFYADDLETNRK